MSRTFPLLNRFEDPETSTDPRVRALVEKLSALDYAPAPRPEFRSELRAQLVAIAGRVVAESEAAGPATTDPVDAASSTTGPKRERPVTRQRRRVGHPLGLAAACCAVLALGFGGAVWKSRSSLPGDSLYGLKRASENVQLSLASGDTARGHDYLELATTRVREATDLVGENSALASGSGVQAAGLSPSTVSLIRSTLRSADGDVTSGSSLLGTEAVTSHSPSALSIMTGWAPSQLSQLAQLATDIGTGPAHASALHSWTVTHTALARARTLESQVGPHCKAARADAYGPISCSSVAPHTAPSTATPKDTSKPGSRHGAKKHAKHGARPSSTGSTAPGRARAHHAKHPAGTGPATSKPTRPGTLPTTLPSLPKLPTLPTLLPSTLPSLPFNIDSCGVSTQVGPIGVHIGSCPTGS